MAIDEVHDSPRRVLIDNPQLMAARPMEGIGRECGIERLSPRCSLRSKKPASSRASSENGGDLTSPAIQRSGLSSGLIT